MIADRGQPCSSRRRPASRCAARRARSFPGPVLRQPVPDHQELARQVAQQMAEEIGHLGGMDGAGIEPEVKVSPGDPGRRR